MSYLMFFSLPRWLMSYLMILLSDAIMILKIPEVDAFRGEQQNAWGPAYVERQWGGMENRERVKVRCIEATESKQK